MEEDSCFIHFYPKKPFVWHGSRSSNQVKQNAESLGKRINELRLFIRDVSLPPSYAIDQVILSLGSLCIYLFVYFYKNEL